MARTLNMTDGSPGKLLFSFALPLMFGNIFQQLYTIMDTAIVGRGVGMLALAALGTVDWLNWMMLGIAQGFTQGFCIRMSQKFGAQDLDGLKKLLQSDFLAAYDSLPKEDQRRLWRTMIEEIHIDGTNVTGIKPRY